MWRRIGMDKQIFTKLLGEKVLIVNNENFILKGTIQEVFDNSIAFRTHLKTRYLSFDRILEIRPLWG